MNARTLPALIALMLCVAPPAMAQETASPDDEFNALLTRAVEAYNAQRFEQAIEDFQRAYEIQPQPEIIYNIARIYERSLQRQQAIEQYERFLSLPNTTSDLRARAATALESLRTEMAAIERVNRAATGATDVGGAGGAQGSTGTPPPPPPPQRQRPAGAVIAGWLLVGLGGATLIGGVTMGALALTEETATEEAANLDEQSRHIDRGETYALSADILFGAGGALAIGGIVALIVHAVRNRNAADEAEAPAPDEEEDDTATSMIFAPYLGQNGLGFTLGGRF